MPLDRRTILAAGAGALSARGGAAPSRPLRTVPTVLGPVDPSRLGIVLVHEHVLVDFIGADRIGPGRYDREEAFRTILPHLRRLRELGAGALLECTPRYLGRDPGLLVRLSRESGLHLITNTGLYGAAGGKYLPAKVRDEATVDELSSAWVGEARSGIEGTGVRPGFVKIGVDGVPFPEYNRRLVLAAARVAREAGLSIHQHSGSGAAALHSLELIGPDLARRFVWVHAQSEQDESLHRRAAEAGAWVEFDGIAPDTVDRHVALVLAMKRAGHLRRTLISHDAGWYHVGEPGGGRFRPFDTLFERFRPAYRAAGGTAEDLAVLLEENPRRLLTGAP